MPYLPPTPLPEPPSGGGAAPLELLALELSLLLSPLPPPRNSRSCRFGNRFQNDSRLAFCFFIVSTPQRLPSLSRRGGCAKGPDGVVVPSDLRGRRWCRGEAPWLWCRDRTAARTTRTGTVATAASSVPSTQQAELPFRQSFPERFSFSVLLFHGLVSLKSRRRVSRDHTPGRAGPTPATRTGGVPVSAAPQHAELFLRQPFPK